MKKLLIILLSLGLAFGASAQKGFRGFHGGGVYYRPHVAIGLGFYSPFYPYYGLYGPMYYGFGYPPYYRDGYMPAELSFKIDDVKNDYKARIKDVKHNKSLTHKEKRQQIRELKKEREDAITQTKRDYYYDSKRNRNNSNNSN